MWYLSFVVLCSLAGADSLFCSFGSTVVVQFELLASRLKNIMRSNDGSESSLWKEMEILVDYHNFFLSYCADLNKIFKSVFLLQFGISIASAGVSVFIFMQPGALSNRVKFILYFATLMIQTGFYCVPLEIVINTAQDVDGAAYDARWYKIGADQFKKCLTVIMGRAQSPLIFSGYGMIDMDLRTYVLICKTVFSFYTYMKNVAKL